MAPVKPTATTRPSPVAMPQRSASEFEILGLQLVPLAEVKTVPDAPTATNKLLAKMIAFKDVLIPEASSVHALPPSR